LPNALVAILPANAAKGNAFTTKTGAFSVPSDFRMVA